MDRNFFINVNVIPPCKGCQVRNLGCHSKCPGYLEFKKTLEEEHNKVLSCKEKENLWNYKKRRRKNER